MDDQQTYLLNGLLTRQYALGRIVRFRKVARGRQATTYELLTAEQHEYLVYLLPAVHDRERLSAAAAAIEALDKHRFSVMPMVRSTAGEHVCEGPQGTHLMVGMAGVGSAFAGEQYTEHDVSQVGLRLAWMHRLMDEQLEPAKHPTPMSEQLAAAEKKGLPAGVSAELAERAAGMMRQPAKLGWVHGDIQPAGMLMDSDHQLRSLTDWALLHWGSPLEDVVDAFIGLCMRGGQFVPARGRALLESYDSLQELGETAWAAVVGRWLAQRIVDGAAGRRALGEDFAQAAAGPEALAAAIKSCTRGGG